jgi:hypothetical protein
VDGLTRCVRCSGLEMPKPPGDGSTIPAGMYCEYLEEFYSHFVKPRATSW